VHVDHTLAHDRIGILSIQQTIGIFSTYLKKDIMFWKWKEYHLNTHLNIYEII